MYGRLFQLQEETLKTLANQKRLEIVQLLGQGELTVSEMIEMLGISQSNLSQHLAVLRRYQIVATRKEGLYVYYRLTDGHIAEAIKQLREFLKIRYAYEPEITKLNRLNDPALYPIVKDPVCGMRLSESEAYASVMHNNKSYHFCASGCYDKFTAHTARYINVKNVNQGGIPYAL
ncbi:hypothetical protein RAAC3_TM7C00001G0135 [Candidatus Saccharibacteria bacterium RAAC3_TM7_1]|nr:hypothetical protein RAAC3_TM7C00001G0135 [Candidatus Saccharibacteria bacterium RAAC3_TM7_1]HCZ28840.1 YHS domain-containing protein [Candidatus Saccharibacteria bacterium]